MVRRSRSRKEKAMRNFVWVPAVVGASILIVGQATPATAEEKRMEIRRGGIDALLAEFSKAISELDIKKTSALFLPPDDTPAGRNRRRHLAEMRKDWTRARQRGTKLSASFREVKKIVRANMVCREGSEPGRTIPVEIEVALTNRGWRIVSMRNLPEGEGVK